MGEGMDFSSFFLNTFPPIFTHTHLPVTLRRYRQKESPTGFSASSTWIIPLMRTAPYLLRFEPFSQSRPSIPYLPKPGTPTGLSCPGENCSHWPAHQLIYFNPAHQPNAPLIGLRCPHNNQITPNQNNKNNKKRNLTYVRQYNLALFKPALAELIKTINCKNKTRSRPATAPRHRSPTSDVFDMQINQLLNDDLPTTSQAPQAPRNGAFRNTRPRIERPEGAQSCKGVGGKTAKVHLGRKNAHCAVGACAACCTTLNDTITCSKHLAQKQTRAKHAPVPKSSILHTGETHSAHLTPDSDIEYVAANSPANSSYTRRLTAEDDLGAFRSANSPANRSCTRRLIAEDDLGAFRSTTLMKQVQERTASQALQVAQRTITLIVWLGKPGQEKDREIWRFACPTWPALALQDVKKLKLFVEAPEELDGELQVWSTEDRGWVSVEITTVQQYAQDTRRVLVKVLVKVAQVLHNNCNNVDVHINSLQQPSLPENLDISKNLSLKTPTPSPVKRYQSDSDEIEAAGKQAVAL